MVTSPLVSHTARMKPLSGSTHELVSFRVARQHYALPVQTIQEIRHYEMPLLVPGVDKMILGILPLRDKAIPLIDLSAAMGHGPVRPTHDTVAMLMQWEGKAFGFVADEVSDVLEVHPDRLQAIPALDRMVRVRWVQGVVDLGDRTLTVLDLPALISGVFSATLASLH